MLSRMPRKLRRLLVGVFYGPSTLRLRDYEKRIFGALQQECEREQAEILREQLNSLLYIKRWHPGRFHRIFIDRSACRPFELQAESACIGTLSLSGGRKSKTCKITTYEGYLFSLEFQGGSLDPHREPFEIVKVEIGGSLPRVAEEIDAEEHGD